MKTSSVKSSLMLLTTALVWGVAFVAQKDGMDYVGPFTYNAVRYLIGGAMPHGVKEPYAEEITQAEYEAIKRDAPDPEDDAPADPEPDNPPLTRAELTAKVAELEATNEFLTNCILEMSEMIYA